MAGGAALMFTAVEAVPSEYERCWCCGTAWWRDKMVPINLANGKTEWACAKHQFRNPCAIEKCPRTTEAAMGGRIRFYADNQFLCSEHWRRYVPPRSRLRKAYHAHFRRAKRHDWTPESKRAFWRFWDTLVARARRQATDGHIDMAEINRVMGWDKEEIE